MKAVRPKMLSNYGAGLLHFTQFCDEMKIPEDLQMPAPEWLSSHFITTKGASTFGCGAMRMWLLSLELWHTINMVPWHGASHLQHSTQGSWACAPSSSFLDKGPPITIAHLRLLKQSLNLSNSFDASVWAIATISFWCQCHLSEVCVDSSFNASLHPSHSTSQKSGVTASSTSFHLFWAPNMKTRPFGEYIMWTDSCDDTSTRWAFNNHLNMNTGCPSNAHLFTFETESGSLVAMQKSWFMS